MEDSYKNTAEEITAGSEPAESKCTPVSDRKIKANRENALKSTGPKSAAGKATSRFNALKHGLLAKRLLFSPDGKPEDEGLAELHQGLRQKYGEDVVAELLIESVVADYWRNGKGLEHEIASFRDDACKFHPHGNLPTINRYVVSNRRALLSGLRLLEELKSQQPEPSAETESET
jgi:hypothetical protein